MNEGRVLAVRSKSALSQDERLLATPMLARLMRRPELGAVAGTVAVFLFFAAVAGHSGMFSALGIVNFLEISAEIGILATAVSLLMIGGEFDLSIGSTIAFTGMVLALLVTQLGWPVWAGVLAAFATAIVIGWCNGFLVMRTGLPSFIVTLASMFILRGATLVSARGFTGVTQVPYVTQGAENDFIVRIMSGTTGHGLFVWLAHHGWIALRSDGQPFADGIPVSILWWIGLSIVATWILLRTRFGNWIFAVGGDANAARNVGVPVAKVKIVLFILTACTATLLAMIQVLTAGSADTLRGTQREFEAIIAAVIGGNLLTGGYGSAIGAMFGALIFGTVSTGIFYTGVDTDWFKIFLGAMVLIAVLFNDFVRRRATSVR
jgi:simple sugar transport system permease protein